MSKLSYRTLANERPQGKPNVYFSCHPDDFGQYFEDYAVKILKIQDCAIWYESEPETDYDKEDLELNLSQMQLIVMPVTARLLTESCRAIEVELPLAIEKHIPILPLMMEQGLDSVFAKYFGDLQYLEPNNRDETRRSFDEALVTYITSVLFGKEKAEMVRAAFDAYIFLSYRKKDRRKAQELMRMIHHSPLCRDIAIWYDEFLTPGEDFNDAIEKMLEKSDLFALVVTPNLVNEVNYVMTREYPTAMDLKKPVLPFEMEKTDRGKLEKHYESLPPCVPGEENIVFHAELLKKIMTLVTSSNDEDPEHNYLIGLAYLDGIDVEVDTERALELITSAAEDGVPEAMKQLVVMYETGKGVTRDYHEEIKWREKHVRYLRKVFEIIPSEKLAVNLIRSIWELGNAQYELRNLDAAENAYNEMYILAMRFAEPDNYLFRSFLSTSFIKLGNIAAEKGDLEGAKRYYEKGLSISKELAEKTNAIECRRELSVNYVRLGNIAKSKGDLEEAQRYYEKGLVISEDLAENAGTPQIYRYLALSLFRLGVFYFNQISRDKAKVMFMRVEELEKRYSDEYVKELAHKAIFILVKYY